MVVANKSAPATFAVAALFANLAALAAGRGFDLKRRYLALLTSRTALVIAAVVALFAASLAWSIDRHFTTRGLVEGVPELAFALAMSAAWPLVARRSDFRWLILGLLCAAALMVFEKSAGMPLHALVHARGEAWDLKRSAIPPVLLLWPALAYCASCRRWLLAAGLVVAALVGIVVAHSGAPGLGLGLAAAGVCLALLAPRVAVGVFGVVLLGLIVAGPWTGTLASRLLPAGTETALSEEHAAHRLRIWTAFEERAHDRPLLGHGYNTSFKVSVAPRPGAVAPGPDDEVMLDIHPHNIFLQFWVELGVLGGLAAAAVSAFMLSRMWRLSAAALAPRLGLLASVVGVGLVGLSAWQAWWLATIAASLIWFDVLDLDLQSPSARASSERG